MYVDHYGDVIKPLSQRDAKASVNERARLAALRHSRADDPDLRPALDQIAACVAVTLDVPLAAVSLVADETVILAGAYGFERRQMLRANSFCDEIVRLGARLRVADAADDPRFIDHEYVALGGVRAYAGAPIKAPGGEILGAVSAFSGDRDKFAAAALDDLEALAHMVELLFVRSGAPEIELPRLRRQGWIGVRTLDARRAGTAARAGLVILSVARGSPAEQAGLRPTDILYTLDDRILQERADLVAALADREPGAAVRITFQRAGNWLEKSILVGTRQPSAPGRPMT